jgi:hypothetical protein
MASYVIKVRVQGELDVTWSAMFSVIHVEPQPDGTTLLTGSLPDQSAVHGLLGAIRDFGLSILTAETVAVPCAPGPSKSKAR